MAIVIPLQRRRPLKVEANKYSAEAFWRKSMVPASIGMGVIIVAAVATLGIGVKTGWLGHDSSKWVLVAALVSVIGLTKIVIANMFFFLLMQDEARLDPPPAPPPPTPGTRVERQTRPLADTAAGDFRTAAAPARPPQADRDLVRRLASPAERRIG